MSDEQYRKELRAQKKYEREQAKAKCEKLFAEQRAFNQEVSEQEVSEPTPPKETQ
jgi:hypothetical protein